jgi:hypothetical protein
MSAKDVKLRGLYGRLTGLKYSLPSGSITPETIAMDFNKLVVELGQTLGESLSDFVIHPTDGYNSGGGKWYYYTEILRSKVEQLLGYLNSAHFTSEKIVEIGSLYNVILDKNLKDRCSDLLTAAGAFDRAINQATLVLEDRIRAKASLQDANLSGKELVNRAINSDPEKSLLVMSRDRAEHEGIAHICRGIVGAFRNPTHHFVLDHYTREDALRLCGFIDQLLSLIAKAKVRASV